MSLFIPIAKVDEEKRLVYGVATAEELDNSGEIYDYATSKPFIEAWSNSFVEKTNGQSCGNLRAMHEAVSAGKLVELEFDDDQKQVQVCAKIVDDNEWKKTLEGVYTGFSFGGRALKKWDDPAAGGKRYTLKPSELSLADKPCVPSAVFFDVVKVDGTVEKRQFKTPLKGSASAPKKDDVQKNMYDVSSLAELLARLNGIRSNAVWEAQNEGDNSPVPGKLKDAIDNLAIIMVEMTQEETAELTAKLDTGNVQKAGARNSKEDMDKIQTIHDHSVTLGAACSQQKVAKADGAAANKDKEVNPMAETKETNVTKLDIETEVKKALDPLSASIQKLSGAVEKFEQTAGTIEDINKRLAKLEAQPAAAKAVVKTVGKEADDQVAKVEGAAADALSEIKKAHNSPTWAY